MIVLEKTPSQQFSKRLAKIKFAQLIANDLDKINDVKNIELKKSYLFNSYIISLVSSWQVFVEDLLRFSVDKIVGASTNANINIIIKNNCNEKIKKFNTPNTDNIDNIFRDVLGIEKITNKLNDSIRVKKQVNDTLDIRHKIAHKGHSSTPLNMSDNFDKMSLLFETAQELESLTFNHIGI